jgi:hypothetical protein
MSPHTQTRILCLGDSLTDGYTDQGAEFTPYGESLKAALTKAGRKVDVVIDGESGDQVTAGSFGRRMTLRCKAFICCLICVRDALEVIATAILPEFPFWHDYSWEFFLDRSAV